MSSGVQQDMHGNERESEEGKQAGRQASVTRVNQSKRESDAGMAQA